MNRNKPSKQPQPSYEDGKLRDPRVAEKQDKDFTRADLLRALGKATGAKNAPKRPEASA